MSEEYITEEIRGHEVKIWKTGAVTVTLLGKEPLFLFSDEIVRLQVKASLLKDGMFDTKPVKDRLPKQGIDKRNVKCSCVKCNEPLSKTINDGLSYCDNDECENRGLITVMCLFAEDK